MEPSQASIYCGMFRWWKLMSEFLKWKLKCSNKRLVSSEPPSSPLLRAPFKEPKYLPGQNANYTLNCRPVPHQDLLLTFRNICLDRQFRALVVMHGWNRTLSCQHSAICGEKINVFVVVSQKTTRLFIVCQVKQKRTFIWCWSLKKIKKQWRLFFHLKVMPFECEFYSVTQTINNTCSHFSQCHPKKMWLKRHRQKEKPIF